MIESLLQAWRGLVPRERRMVSAAAAVVMLAIGYLAFFEPAWSGRQALERELPVLRGQLARMAGLAEEARLLAAVPQAADSTQSQKAALEQSLRAAGMGPQLTQISLNGELFDLRFQAVPHAVWLAWLDAALRETRLRVADVAIARDPAPGVVSVRVVLEAPGRDRR